MTNPLHHPAAAVWPTLDEPDLRRLADDIKANGLQHPIVMLDGKILDGRNRHAACGIAGVEPTYVQYEGDDPIGYVLSSNNERRHMSLPERAAAVALTLATDGARENGRWAYGKVSETSPDSDDRQNWTTFMSRAGLVLDMLGADVLQAVAKGGRALDDAYSQAVAAKAEAKRRAELPDDLGALVDAGDLSISDALRRAKLPERYARLVASGDLDLDEAEHLAQRDDRERRDAIDRYVGSIRAFLHGWNTASNLADDPNRDDVLEALDDLDRARFLEIEKEIA